MIVASFSGILPMWKKPHSLSINFTPKHWTNLKYHWRFFVSFVHGAIFPYCYSTIPARTHTHSNIVLSIFHTVYFHTDVLYLYQCQFSFHCILSSNCVQRFYCHCHCCWISTEFFSRSIVFGIIHFDSLQSYFIANYLRFNQRLFHLEHLMCYVCFDRQLDQCTQIQTHESIFIQRKAIYSHLSLTFSILDILDEYNSTCFLIYALTEQQSVRTDWWLL